MARVFIGVDPHKLSATTEVVDEKEMVLATGRFATDEAGYTAMRSQVAGWSERAWSVEGSNGAGRPLAQRLLADGEHVVDVPAKLSARARSSTPATTARRTLMMRTPWPWSRCAPPAFGCCPMTPRWRCCGCWPTAETS